MCPDVSSKQPHLHAPYAHLTEAHPFVSHPVTFALLTAWDASTHLLRHAHVPCMVLTACCVALAARPGIFDQKGRAKYDYWAKQQGGSWLHVARHCIVLVGNMGLACSKVML